MKYFTSTFFALIICFSLSAQDYTTPNTGVKWNLDSLVQNNPSTISIVNEAFVLNGNLTVAENDSLFLKPNDSLKINQDIEVTIAGFFQSLGNENEQITITATDTLNPYEGFRFEEISTVEIDRTTIQYGGGLKVITPNLTLTNSTIFRNVEGSATGAAISLSNGSPLIENNEFIQNDLPAVSSGANQQVSAKILNNYLQGNGQANENRPQLNMGPTGADTLKIENNIILGDRDLTMVGGIAVSNFIGGEIHTIIKNNEITDNRYGMTIAGGNAEALIKGNIIENNDTQGEPNLGGSGISLNSGTDTQTIMITDNSFRGNLWGITIIDEASANLGDEDENPGNNVFSDNGNSGDIFALYNNTDNTILAKNNCWIEGQTNTLADAESVIFHEVDDPSLGLVDFDPVNCSGLSNPAVQAPQITMYPNPVENQLNFSSSQTIESLEIFALNGKRLRSFSVNENKGQLNFQLSSGLYLIKFKSQNGSEKTEKLIVN